MGNRLHYWRQFQPNDQTFHPSKITRDADEETACLAFAGFPQISPDAAVDGTLLINFGSPIGHRADRGFYMSPLIDEEDVDGSEGVGEDEQQDQHCVFATNFEATGCRHVFPCVDIPSAKATFTLSLTTPSRFNTLLFNTPISSSTRNSETTTAVFAPTPLMSTYLLAWAIADAYTFVEATTNRGIQVRVFVENRQKEDAEFSLKMAVTALEWYEQKLGVAYTLPKLDLFPIPEFEGEALECWGLCLFEESLLLLEKGAQPEDQMDVATLVTHEIAHQWFGNITTMPWWNELWLNESFADWAQYGPAHALYPSWDVYDTFFENEDAVGFEADASFLTHAMVTDVRARNEVEGIFDEISYKKGAAVVRMFEHWVDATLPKESSWYSILGEFLKQHSFKLATSMDLIRVIDTHDSSGEIGKTLNEWINLCGYPVIWLDSEGFVRTERFTLWKEDGAISEQANRVAPFSFCQVESLTIKSCKQFALTGKAVPVEAGKFLIPNPDRAGFYRFLPSQSHLTVLFENLNILQPSDRAGLLSDLSALALSNRIPVAMALQSFSKILPHETHSTVWRVTEKLLNTWIRAMRTHKWYSKFFTFVQRLIFPAATRVGWFWDWTGAPLADTSFTTTQLRNTLLPLAVKLRHPSTMINAEKTLAYWLARDADRPFRAACKALEESYEEDHEFVIKTVYTYFTASDAPRAFKLLRDEDVDLPGGLSCDRLDPLFASPVAAHWETLMDFGRVLKEDREFDSVEEARDARVSVLMSWLEVVSGVAVGDSWGGEETRVEAAWRSLRGVGQSPASKKGSKAAVKTSFEGLLDAFQGLSVTGQEHKVNSWDYLVKCGDQFIGDHVETIVSYSRVGGSVWKDALACLGVKDFRHEPASGPNLVLNGIRKGMERAEALDKFRKARCGNIVDFLKNPE
ncbi:peptidase family M1-domain-containing protein [Chytriomyces sp. MP71]|nr:peptidase family M1-domain-containing protein [Chytriomyces sp. MP71]